MYVVLADWSSVVKVDGINHLENLRSNQNAQNREKVLLLSEQEVRELREVMDYVATVV